jgi:hypothetical protein
MPELINPRGKRVTVSDTKAERLRNSGYRDVVDEVVVIEPPKRKPGRPRKTEE